MRLPRLFIALVFLASGTVQAADAFTFSNAPGPYGVGLKLVQQYDRARLYKPGVDLATGEPTKGERRRPVQALVWYPAARGGKPVSYRDYMDTIATEDDFTRTPAEIKAMTEKRINANAGTRRDAVLREVARPMLAVRDAAPARGEAGAKFPVVIYAPSYSAFAAENADLCELLASHGYIVLSSPSQGAHTRPMTVDVEGVETQAADISYLIGYAATLPQADTDKVAVAGFSWGGLSNVVAAARDARIKALVSLDGSLRSYPSLVDGGKDAVKYVTPANVALPLLYVGARPKTVEVLNSSDTPLTYSFMNGMKYSDVYIVSLLPMKHMHFSSYAMRMVADDDFGDYTRDEISLAHSWAARYTLRFLDAYLKNDATGLAFLNAAPKANGAPPHMVLTDIRRKKEDAPPTLENYVRRLATDGFDKAIPAYERMMAQQATFKLGPNEIIGWGLQLRSLDRPAQSREIFRLGAHLFPNESIMFDGLGEMQAKAGQTQEALASYRRLLELDPKNADAIRFVKEHGGAGPTASAP